MLISRVPGLKPMELSWNIVGLKTVRGSCHRLCMSGLKKISYDVRTLKSKIEDN